MPEGRITEHFSWAEARCRGNDCSGWGDAAVQAEIARTAEWLEEIRRILGGHAVHISSWYRCKHHNAEIPGSASHSIHLTGRAVDFVVREMSPSTVQKILSKHRDLVRGLGKYAGWTHADRRDGPPATWRG